LSERIGQETRRHVPENRDACTQSRYSKWNANDGKREPSESPGTRVAREIRRK